MGDQPQLICDNDLAIIFQNSTSMKLLQVRAGDKFQNNQGGSFRFINMIGKPWGCRINAYNNQAKFVYVLKPKASLITETLARKTQILYSMDNAAILFKLSVKPGSVVVEAGTGSGSLSCAISEAIGKVGHLYTFEFNKERAESTGRLFENLGKTNITSTWRDVVAQGFAVENQQFKADCLFLDIPNPWAALHHAKHTLHKNAKICCFSPCIEQVQKTCAEMQRQKYRKIETQEVLARQIQSEQKETQLEAPEGSKRMRLTKGAHNGRGHTGYLTFAVA